MTVDTNAIINLIIDVLGEQQIQVTTVRSLKGALIAGSCAFIGGLLAGPIGLAVGGASGGALAAYNTSSFKPIGQILNELPFERKQQIAAEIQSIIDQLEVNDLTELVRLVAIYQTLAQPERIAIDTLARQALPVLQKHLGYQ